jgi:hypothetical protein
VAVTVTDVGTASDVASATTLTIAGVALAAGEVLLVSVKGGVIGEDGPPDSVLWGGEALTQVVQSPGPLAIYALAPPATSGTNDLVATWGGGTVNRAMTASRVTGLKTSGLKLDASGSASGFVTAPATSITNEPKNGQEFAFAAFSVASSTSGTWGGGFTGHQDVAVGVEALVTGYKVLTNIDTPTASKSTSQAAWDGAILTWRVASTYIEDLGVVESIDPADTLTLPSIALITGDTLVVAAGAVTNQDPPTGATWGATPLVVADTVGSLKVFYLPNASAGTHDIVVTWASGPGDQGVTASRIPGLIAEPLGLSETNSGSPGDITIAPAEPSVGGPGTWFAAIQRNAGDVRTWENSFTPHQRAAPEGIALDTAFRHVIADQLASVGMAGADDGFAGVLITLSEVDPSASVVALSNYPSMGPSGVVPA